MFHREIVDELVRAQLFQRMLLHRVDELLLVGMVGLVVRYVAEDTIHEEEMV
jgi:hypothetical protein